MHKKEQRHALRLMRCIGVAMLVTVLEDSLESMSAIASWMALGQTEPLKVFTVVTKKNMEMEQRFLRFTQAMQALNSGKNVEFVYLNLKGSLEQFEKGGLGQVKDLPAVISAIALYMGDQKYSQLTSDVSHYQWVNLGVPRVSLKGVPLDADMEKLKIPVDIIRYYRERFIKVCESYSVYPKAVYDATGALQLLFSDATATSMALMNLNDALNVNKGLITLLGKINSPENPFSHQYK